MTLKGKSLEVCAVLHLSYAGDTDKWNTELIEKIEKVLDDGPESLKNETEIWWKETISSLDTCLHVMPMARILPSSTEAFSQ